MKETKQLSLTIQDNVREKLERIKLVRGLQNDAEAIEFSIKAVYERLDEVLLDEILKVERAERRARERASLVPNKAK